MRRGHIVLLVLLPFTASASAQQTRVAPGQMLRLAESMITVAPTATPEIVVARILSFDRNKDGRVSEEELPERMLSLLANDANGDSALDRDELEARIVATSAPVATMPAGATVVPGFPRGGGYTFGDQIGLSTRSHVEGALDDLRLDGLAHEQALVIVQKFMDTLEKDAAATLVRELTPTLSEGQLQSFRAMIGRQLSRGGPANGPANNAAPLPPPFNKTIQVQVFNGEPDLAFRIRQFGLPQEQTDQALAALERFKATIRPGDVERPALLEQLTGVLSDEERDNFGAALARRPLVKAGGVIAGGFTIERKVLPGDVVGGVVNGIVIVRPTLPSKPVVP